MVQYIRQTSKVTVKEFNNLEISKHFWIDTQNCKCEQKINKQWIFELLSAISQESTVDVRENMVERIRLDPLYYKRIGHVILGFKNMELKDWCDVMAKQTTSVDELVIFALSKIYQRHMVIFNASKLWSTLEPDGEMLEEELFKHCEIHLVYMGKYQYTTLHRKPFIEQAAPPSLKSMLDPMKIRHTNKRMCQREPMDLSLQTTRSTDVSLDADNSVNVNETLKNHDEDGEPKHDLLGNNNNTTNDCESPVVP